jgi:hypothetical protein
MRDTHNVIWGVFLIVIGVLLLLERVAGLHIPTGSLWPLVLFAMAASSAARGRIGSAVMFTMLGAIFLGVTFNVFGLSYHKSWPLLMVAAGVVMVVRSFFHEPRIASREEVPHE